MANNYESEITRFLKEYKNAHADVEKRQCEGRARLWDKVPDVELLDGFHAACVTLQPYVYQVD